MLHASGELQALLSNVSVPPASSRREGLQFEPGFASGLISRGFFVPAGTTTTALASGASDARHVPFVLLIEASHDRPPSSFDRCP